MRREADRVISHVIEHLKEKNIEMALMLLRNLVDTDEEKINGGNDVKDI